MLADTVRTDRRRLTPLTPDTPATTSLRTLVRARADLVQHRVAMVNQLRAHLLTVLPGMVGLFCELTSPISRAFLTAFGTQDAVDALTLDELTAWLAGQRYRRTRPAILLARLHDAPTGVTGPAGTALAGVTHAYLSAVTAVIQQITALEEQIAAALAAHPDGPIFTSLPRAGTVRAARLLAEIGDARGRYPTPESLICLAGAAPSTRQSGKVKVVAYRWAVDKQLRGAVIDFAGDSHHTNAWAADLYAKARARNHDHPHAVRILARAWLHVIWRCWQDGVPYDPTKHRALQRLIDQAA
jgi:transposase